MSTRAVRQISRWHNGQFHAIARSWLPTSVVGRWQSLENPLVVRDLELFEMTFASRTFRVGSA